MVTFTNGWRQVAICALLLVPLVLIIVLMSPAFLVLPFLEKGREFIPGIVDKGTEWVRIVVSKIETK